MPEAEKKRKSKKKKGNNSQNKTQETRANDNKKTRSKEKMEVIPWSQGGRNYRDLNQTKGIGNSHLLKGDR